MRSVAHGAHQQAGAEPGDQQPAGHAQPGQHHLAGQCGRQRQRQSQQQHAAGVRGGHRGADDDGIAAASPADRRCTPPSRSCRGRAAVRATRRGSSPAPPPADRRPGSGRAARPDPSNVAGDPVDHVGERPAVQQRRSRLRRRLPRRPRRRRRRWTDRPTAPRRGRRAARRAGRSGYVRSVVGAADLGHRRVDQAHAVADGDDLVPADPVGFEACRRATTVCAERDVDGGLEIALQPARPQPGLARLVRER